MKYIIYVLFVCIAPITASAKYNIIISNKLIDSLAIVESNNDSTKVGKMGELGILQIKKCVIDDVNKIYKTNYVIDDAKNNTKAKEICKKYLQHWGYSYEKKTKNKATDRILAMIWNGGPLAPLKTDVQTVDKLTKYWLKVRSYM